MSLWRHLGDAWSWERRQNDSVNIQGEARSNFLQAGEAEAEGLEKREGTYYIMPVLQKTQLWLCDVREAEARPKHPRISS